jgi:N-acylneuraminate cytidylyltransferase
MTKSIAIITARGGSKRIPRKNIKNFCGFPIIKYSIEAAINSKCFVDVMVSTDDKEIANIAKQFGATVPFFRSENTSNDYATTADVIEEVLLEYKKLGKNFDYACCIYPTAPFITKSKLKEVYNLIVSKKADSVIPVVKFDYPIQRALKIENMLLKFIWSENLNKRSQDLEPSYHDCGQFYFFKTSSFLESKKLFSENTIPFEMPASEVQDIDNEEDWIIAEMKYKLLNTL